MLALMGAAAIGNRVPVSIFFGFDWLWGGIGVLLAIRYGRRPAGSLAALFAGLGAFWGGRLGWIYLFEGLWVDHFWHRTRRNMLLLDSLYWLVLAAIIALCYFAGWLPLHPPAFLFLLMKGLVNGVVNAFIAEAISVLLDSHSGGRLPSLQRVLSTLLIAFVCLGALFLISFGSWQEFRHMEADIRAQLEFTHRTVSVAIQNELLSQARAVALLAEVAEPILADPGLVQRHTQLIQRANSGLLGLYVADEDGARIGFAGDGELTIGPNGTAGEYYLELLQTEKPRVSSLIMSANLAGADRTAPVVILSYPILGEGGIRGYAAGLLDFAKIPAILSPLIHADDTITLVDRESRVIGSSNPAIAPGTDFWEIESHASHHHLTEAIEHHMPSRAGSPLERWRLSHYVFRQEIMTDEIAFDVPWSIIIERPIGTYIDRLYEYYNASLASFLLFLAVAVLAALLGSYWLGKPIRILAALSPDLLARIRQGQGIHWPQGRVVEHAALIRSYEAMTEAIKEHVDEIELYSRKLEHLAQRDALTGLLNRGALSDRLQAAIESASADDSFCAVLFMDLDRFKLINDTYGHDAGDAILVEFASRLGAVFGSTSSIIRLGGDEFVVVLEEVADGEDVRELIESFLAALRSPIPLGEVEVEVRTSIGVSCFPRDGTDGDTLLSRADIAMYYAKQAGGSGYRFYEREMDKGYLDSEQLASDLRRAINREELRLHFQPIVSCRTLQVVGVEALVRWQHPQLGLLLPDAFLPAAEDSDLILAIDAWVLQKACSEVLRRFPRETPLLFVNLSGRHLRDGDRLLDMVRTVLEGTSFDPSALILEVAETALVEHVDLAVRSMNQLRRIGLRFALDDVGKGCSSLAYLARLPISVLKISRCFADVEGEELDTLLEMAKGLGIIVIIEGIETVHQLDFFADHQCDLAQGFFFGMPRPIGELDASFRCIPPGRDENKKLGGNRT